jgi:molybdopterin-guanine dinucleotide biosynthesis protein A
LDRPWGLVLAGGPGTRMGGGKPQRELAGRSLAQRAHAALAAVCPRVLVAAQDLLPLAGLPATLLRDRWPGQGPLNAIITAFLDSRAPALLVLAVDLPLVRRPLLELLAAGPEADLARAPVGPRGRPEPLLAYYHRDALPAARRLFQRGERRTRLLLEAVGARLLEPDQTARADPEGLSFLNVNYPEDLDRALRLGRARGLFDTD